MRLFITGFLQVFFVAINTYFLSHKYYLGVMVAGFCISYIWCLNVKKVSISTTKERIIYSCGASCGCVFGLFISTLILK